MKTLSLKNILSKSESLNLISQLNDNADNLKQSFNSSYESTGGSAMRLDDSIELNRNIIDRFINEMPEINKLYNYELDYKSLEFSLVKYEEGTSIPPHMDLMTCDTEPGYYDLIKRKLILITLLNSPDDFEGGILSINIDCKHNVPLEKGQTVCFPAFFTHELSKLTSGERYILSVVVKGKSPFK